MGDMGSSFGQAAQLLIGLEPALVEIVKLSLVVSLTAVMLAAIKRRVYA